MSCGYKRLCNIAEGRGSSASRMLVRATYRNKYEEPARDLNEREGTTSRSFPLSQTWTKVGGGLLSVSLTLVLYFGSVHSAVQCTNSWLHQTCTDLEPSKDPRVTFCPPTSHGAHRLIAVQDFQKVFAQCSVNYSTDLKKKYTTIINTKDNNMKQNKLFILL